MYKPRTLCDTIIYGGKKLIRPFVCWSIAAICLDSLLFTIDRTEGLGYYVDNEICRTIGSLLINGSAHGNMPVWFLFTYFIVKSLNALVESKNSRILSGIVLTVSIFVPYGLQQFMDVRYPYYLSNICIGLAVFMMGRMFNDATIGATEKMAKGVIVALTTLIFIAVQLIYPCYYDVRNNTLCEGNYWIWWIWAIAACFFISYLFAHCKWLVNVADKLGLCWAGRNSMAILCIHWPILVILDFIRRTIPLGIPQNLLIFYYVGLCFFLGVPAFCLLKKMRLIH